MIQRETVDLFTPSACGRPNFCRASPAPRQTDNNTAFATAKCVLTVGRGTRECFATEFIVRSRTWFWVRSAILTIREILEAKGKKVFSVKPTDSIAALSRALRAHHVGAAVVSCDGRSIDGVITERDVTYGLGIHGAGLHDMPVSKLMTEIVITCSPHDTVASVASTMMSRKIRHVPVEEDGQLLGMLSIRDVLHERIDQLQQATAQLRTFVKETNREPQDRE
jgi:CBS domain-containing protein